MSGKNILKLIGCIVLAEVIGGASGFLIRNEITGWYTTLTKPSFNPPNWLFGPVWTTLYLLMGISLYMIIVNVPASKQKTAAIAVWGVQLFLNFWWSIIFFNFHRLDLAMAEIAVLWIMIVWMIIGFYKLKPAAGLLQIPYLLWVSFASALNLAILLLN